MLGRARWGVPLFIFLNVWVLTTLGKFSIAGDEPHYLIIAESLLSDRDLDLRNNYRNGDGRWFALPQLAIEIHAKETRNGTLWSTHDIGVPIVVLPAYAILTRVAARAPESTLARFRMSRGAFGYALVSVAMAAFVAFGLAWLLSGLARITTRPIAIGVTLVVGLAPPVLGHSFLIFPETVAFVVVCGVVWLLCLRPDEVTRRRVIVTVLLIGLTPWLHRKFSPFSLGLLVPIVMIHRDWFSQQPRRLLMVLAGLAITPQIALHLWTFNAWGHVGGPQMLEGVPFSVARFQEGLVGLLFDRERGLFSYAPIYLIVPAAFALTWRVSRWLLVPILLLYVPMASYVVWTGGFSPAARYLVPTVPLLAMAVAGALRSPAVRGAAAVLLVFQGAIGVAIWSHPRVTWPKELATNPALQKIPWVGPGYEHALPSIWTGDSTLLGWVWIGGLALATFLLTRRARSRVSG